MSTQARKPKGTPIGGQFASQHRAESEVRLSATPANDLDNIPTSLAEISGRRLYVYCGYKSGLNTRMRELGAHWDAERKGLWVAASKRSLVLPLLREHLATLERVETVKRDGFPVVIPYAANAVRNRAKELGGIWDKENKHWVLPTSDAAEDIERLLAAWSGQKRSAKPKANKEQIIAQCDRATTGKESTFSGRLDGYFRKADALLRCPAPGTIIRLSPDKEGVVLDSSIAFYSEDDLQDTMPWEDRPGWYYNGTYAELVPTAAQIGDQEDREAVAALWVTCRQGAHGVTAWQQATPVIQAEMNTASLPTTLPERIAVTPDGTWLYQHPGFYDDYRRTEAVIDDPQILERLRTAIDRGPRTLKQGPWKYTILERPDTTASDTSNR